MRGVRVTEPVGHTPLVGFRHMEGHGRCSASAARYQTPLALVPCGYGQLGAVQSGREVDRGVKQWALTHVYVPLHPCEVTPDSPKYAKLLLGWAPSSPRCWAQTPSRVAL